MPDTVPALIQAGMMQGKSVGFIRLKSHAPSSHEIAADPGIAKVSRVIDEWLLIEYACTFLPMNQAALVEAVSKSGIAPERLQTLGLEVPQRDASSASLIVPFTPESELYQAIRHGIAAFDFGALRNEQSRRGLTDPGAEYSLALPRRSPFAGGSRAGIHASNSRSYFN